MSEADDLFSHAYGLHVVEEKHREAIDLCRRALEIDPKNYRARVFLGMLLGDYGSDEEKIESRQQFVEAIKRADNEGVLCNSGYEESAVHHLGIWEWGQEHHYNACLFFLADFLLCKSNESYQFLIRILNELDPSVSAHIKLILERVKT